MIPVLYPANETSFTTNGLGRLTDALTCTVVEEVNEIFELTMTYPLDGIHLDEMQVNMIIYAKPSFGKPPQPFRIREIVKSWGNRVSITARHVKYELASYAVAEFGAHADLGYSEDPILYGSDHKIIGTLTQTISKSIVKNGNRYTMTVVYPTNGTYASRITTSCYLYAQPEVGKNMAEFDITAVSTSGTRITITSSRTGSSGTSPALNQMTVSQALGCVNTYMIKMDGSSKPSYSFTFDAVPDTPNDTWATQTKEFWNEFPVQANELIGSEEGRIVDVFGGEWEWDHYHCIFHEHRGKESGVIYKYGKNITDITATTNIDEFYTHVVSYWKGTMSSSTNTDYTNNLYSEYKVTRGSLIKVLASEYDSMFPNMKTLILDASSEFDEQPTPAQLDDYTRWYIKNEDVGIPRVAIKVDVVDLASTEEYKDYAPLETVQLCDYVTVIFPEFGVDVKEQISRIEYNVLTDKNVSVTIGETKLALADHLASTKGKLRQNKYDNQKWADRCAERAIRASSGWYGGNIRKNYNTTDHKQQSEYVMDSDNLSTADHGLVMDGEGLSGATGLSGTTKDGKPPVKDHIIALHNKYGKIGVNGTAVNFGKIKTHIPEEGEEGEAVHKTVIDIETGINDIYMGDNEKYVHGNNEEFKSLLLPVDFSYTELVRFLLNQYGIQLTYKLHNRDIAISLLNDKILIQYSNNEYIELNNEEIKIIGQKVMLNDIDLVESLGDIASGFGDVQRRLDDHEQRLQNGGL